MPVRLIPFKHGANPIKSHFSVTASNVLRAIYPAVKDQPIQVIQSSFDDKTFPPSMLSSENGLVSSIIEAYSHHHHLTLRPDDIWFAILTQTTIYINAHGEELRDKFVQHEGQKDLKITYAASSRFNVNQAMFARDMAKLVEQNILDPEFRSWMMPTFSTSTLHDEVVASIIMIASMKKYFRYYQGILCGMPSVTLLGEKGDYEQILQKLDKLETLGTEPGLFAAVLRPVVKRFIDTFDNPTDKSIVDFWRSIVNVSHECGTTEYTGWVTAFCFWEDDGTCLYLDRKHTYERSRKIAKANKFLHKRNKNILDDDSGEELSWGWERLVLDGVMYHMVEKNQVPPGWSKVPVIINDHGKEIETEIIAGSVGISCSSNGIEDDGGATHLDTMQPKVGCWMYEKNQDN